MFGIFEVYTYERLYNPSTYLFICMYIYIYQPQLVSEFTGNLKHQQAQDFFGKKMFRQMLDWFFSGFIPR